MTSTAPPTHVPSPWGVFRLIAGAVLLSTLNYSVVFVAFSDIQESLDTSATALSWTLTAFSITVAALLVPGGWLADRYGRSRVFVGGFAVFVLGSFLVAIAPSVEFMVAARVVQAAGLAIESPAALALVLDAFPKHQRSTAVGATGAVGGVAAAIGPAIGGALVGWFGWRWAFFVNVPAGLAVIALVRTRLPADEPRVDKGRPDLVGVALLMLGVGSLALGIVQSDDWGFGSPATLVALTVGLVALTALVRRSAEHPEPILYLPLFRLHDFRRGAVLSFLVAGSFSGMFLAFITFMVDAWELSLLHAGIAVALIPAIGGPMSVVAGRVADRVGHRWVIAPGALCMTIAGLWIHQGVSPERDLWGLWLPAASLYALGVGLSHAACQAAALAEAPVERLGIGGAMNRIFQDVGGTVSVAVVIAVSSRYLDPVDSLKAAMVLLMISSLAGVPLAAGLHGRGQDRSAVTVAP